MSQAPSERSKLFPWLQALCLILAAYALFGAVKTDIYALQGAPNLGTLGAHFERVESPTPRTVRVKDLTPNSPFLAAGVHNGDLIVLARSLDDERLDHTAGEVVRFTRVDPPAMASEVAAVPVGGTPEGDRLVRMTVIYPWLLDGCTTFISVLVGALIVLRARGSWALLLLGFSFIAFCDYVALPERYFADVFPVALVSTYIFKTLAGDGFLIFSILLYRETVAPVGRWLWLGVGVCLLSVMLMGIRLAVEVSGAPYGAFAAVIDNFSQLVFISALIGIVIGWRRSRLELQKRYAVMTVAVVLVIAADITFYLDNITILGSNIARPGILIAQGLSASGHLLFAYAVLRDKVIDLGFVVNRAVVYGVISALLLVAFGLVEWGAEKIIPESWLAQGKAWKDVFDALIALGVYLVFHRVRDAVERFIERLFFHKWHSNEAALRRFVHEADFITEPKDLLKAFAVEVTRFCHGATADIFLRDETGSFVAGSGRLDTNDPAMVALRARRAAVEPAASGSAVAAALILPFSHRGDIFGCMLVGQSPAGTSYRPDEIEVLQWAAHQIGLDYHALKVEALETEAAVLRQQNAALTGAIGQALSPKPASSRKPRLAVRPEPAT